VCNTIVWFVKVFARVHVTVTTICFLVYFLVYFPFSLIHRLLKLALQLLYFCL
jgi:hypothetical protein